MTASSQVAPSDHQWPSSSVSIAKTSSPRLPRLGGELAQAPGGAGEELAGLAARGRGAGLGVVPVAADFPDPDPAQGLAGELGVGGVGRVAVERPEPAHRLPVDRQRHRAAGGRDRVERVQGILELGALVGAEPAHAVLGQARVEARSVGALRQPEAAVPAEAPAVRADAGLELQAQAGAGRDHRQHRVGRRGGGEGDGAGALGIAEEPQRLAARLVEQLERAAVAVELGFAGGAAFLRDLGRVRFRRADPPAQEELAQPLADTRVLELVGEDRGDAQGDSPCHREQRQVGADHRVEQPLLAERVGPEALDVGHVGVEDDREVALGLRPAHFLRSVTGRAWLPEVPSAGTKV